MFSKRLKRATILLACVATLLCAILGAGPALADQGNTYTVQPGDTLAGIATHHGVAVGELAEANGLQWNAWVYTGQTLVLPSSAVSAPLDMSLYATDPRVPDPLPQLPALLQSRPSSVLSLTYARVAQTGASVYAQPADAEQGLPPKRELGAGFVWVSVVGKTTYQDVDYYEINTGEYVLAENLSLYSPSAFQGLALAAQPERPLAWIVKAVQPTLEPGGQANPSAPEYQRYQLVQIFATEQQGDQVWYLVGPHQWINQVYVGKVEPSAPPEGVEADQAWIEVNLFEQTLAAYVGERMVYATLISSGLPGWNTPQGLFKTWLRVEQGKMSGGYNRPDYYFLEDVPWTMYFHRDVALHTAYWHDGFGYRRSHGCVNLAPLDARWLYNWAPDEVWVWVHAGA